MAAAASAAPADILSFWFDGPAKGKHYWAGSREKQLELDQLIEQRFGVLVIQAVKGELTAEWTQTPTGTLALIILIDQFCRNIYRNTPKAFTYDPIAQKIAMRGIAQKQDLKLPEPHRQFFYLPLYHSENIALLEKGLSLLPSVNYPWNIKDYTKKRIAEMRAFGRVPSRNKARGLESTLAEKAAGY